ncbi:MAG: sugar phosphate isomerase/epimerase [Lachnospiraceae bacterium]|nr:sugar phosphate isomerase/epimerase [Lachnospiraceae bacterium]
MIYHSGDGTAVVWFRRAETGEEGGSDLKLTVFYDHINQAMRQTGKSFEELARELTAAGISGVEMDYGELVKKPRRLCAALKKAGLPISCVYTFFDWGNPGNGPDYKKVIRLLAHCGVPHILAIPGFAEQGQDREACRARMAQTLKQCCGYAAKYGITVGMEDFDDERATFARAEELQWYLEQVPDLSCTFDTGNFLYSEEDALQAWTLLHARVGYVHCKDREFAVKAGEEPKRTVGGRAMYSAAVGSGVIPMEELVRCIGKSGYDGVFAIEHFGSQSMYEDMLASAAWLTRQSS